MTKRQRQKAEVQVIEVCKSFSYKLQHEPHGGAKYESSDYFMSMKTSVPASEVEEMSAKLSKACKTMVLKDVNLTVDNLRTGVWARLVEPHEGSKTNAAAFEKWQGKRNHAAPRSTAAPRQESQIGELAEEALKADGGY